MNRNSLLVVLLSTLGTLLVCCFLIVQGRKEAPTKTAAPPPTDAPLLTGKAALRQALEKKISINAIDEPLDDLVTSIGREVQVQIDFDKKALDDVGLEPDKPVTYRRSGGTARAALEFILRPNGLTWVAEDERLLVTTPEIADAKLETVIYDVTDLVLHLDEKGQWREDGEPLVEAIQGSVKPPSWESVGGPGSIRIVSLPASAALAISQIQDVHEGVERFLADARKVEALRRKGQAIAEPTPEQILHRKIVKSPAVDKRLPGGAAASPEPDNPLGPDPQRDLAVEAANGFTWDLYRQLAHESSGNVCCSPVSIATVLGMAQAGARGQTALEFARVLHLARSADGQQGIAEDRVQPAFSALLGTLHAERSADGYDLLVANRLWGQTGCKWQPAFIDLLAKYYRADLAAVDFSQPRDAARQIDDWTSQHTSNFLRGKLDPALIDAHTRFVLTNAVYFNGLWVEPFEPMTTRLKPFFLEGHSPSAPKTVKVPMMRQTIWTNYALTDGVQILEKRYWGKAMSILFVLPADPSAALAAVEERLSPAVYRKWSGALKGAEAEAEIFLPRFAMETQYKLNESLKALGLAAALDPKKADFSGIDGARELFVQFVVHQARIEVDERGTRAGALSGIVGTFGGPPKPVIFRADRPFLFLIRDTRSGAILFVGRVACPSS
jgi:serpin B